jgi:hypothetical protein
MPITLQNPEVIINHRSGAYLAPVLDVPDRGWVTPLVVKTVKEVHDARLLIRKLFHLSLPEHMF